MASGMIQKHPEVLSIESATLSSKTTDTNGYITGFGNVSNGKRFIVAPKCDAKNVALIPWVTTDGNWYCSAVNPSSLALLKSTSLGDITYLVITLR